MNEILILRENLASIRQQYCNNNTCLQLTLNIPGNNKLIYPAKQLAKQAIDFLKHFFKQEKISFALIWKNIRSGFIVYLYKICCDPYTLKNLLLKQESSHPLSHYWDFDVFNGNGIPITRQLCHHAARQCFLCQEPAKLCALLNQHSILELLQKLKFDYQNFLVANRRVYANSNQ